jgi:hypothetical protein
MEKVLMLLFVGRRLRRIMHHVSVVDDSASPSACTHGEIRRTLEKRSWSGLFLSIAEIPVG